MHFNRKFGGSAHTRRAFEQTLRTRIGQHFGEAVPFVIKSARSGYVVCLEHETPVKVRVHDFSQETGKRVFEKFKEAKEK